MFAEVELDGFLKWMSSREAHAATEAAGRLGYVLRQKAE